MTTKQIEREIALNTLQQQRIAQNTAEAATVKMLTHEQIKQLVAEEGLQASDVEQLKSQLALNVVEGQGLVTTKALTVADINQAVASLNCSDAIKAQTAELLTNILVEKQAIKSTSLLSKALSFVKAHPVMAIVSVIAGIGIATFAKFNVTLKEQQEITKKLKEEYDDLTTQLSEISDELEVIQDRIEELNNKDKLSFVEKQELENLKAENRELERKNELLEKQANLKKQEHADSVKKEYEKKYQNSSFEAVRGDTKEESDEVDKKYQRVSEIDEILNSGYATATRTQEEIDALIEEKNKLQSEIDAYYENNNLTDEPSKQYVNGDEWLEQAIDAYQKLRTQFLNNPESKFNYDGSDSDDKKRFDELEKQLVDRAIEYDSIVEEYGLDDEFSQMVHNKSVKISWVLDPASYKTDIFEEEYDKLLPSAQKELERLINRNELSPETLVNFFPKASIDTLAKYEISVEDIVEQLHTYINATKDATVATTSFVGVLSNVQDLDTGMDLLGSIYKDVKDGGTFDYSSILNNDDFKETFSGYGEEYSNFIKTITTTPDNINECQQAFNDLATAYIYGSGVMEDLNSETKNQTIAMLEQMGVTNAATLVEEQIIANEEELALRKKFLAEYGYDLKYATEEEVSAFLKEAEATDAARFALFNYQVQETIFNNSSLDTSGRMNELVKLAATYGVCADIIEDYNNKQALAEQGINIGTNYTEADIAHFVEQARAEISAELSSATVNLLPNDEKDSESATEILDKYFDYYEKQLQAGQITYHEYVQKCNDIRDKYYNDGKITSAEYYQYLADLYGKELEYYDKVISAVTDAIDDKIDKLEKDKEELEDYYNGLIEKIQSEIDELQKANDERERAIALQKAQYELNRALNQRTDYVYQDGQFIYKDNDSAVRDAQNELDDQLFDMQINELERQIEDLETALEDATETIDKQIDALNEYKDKWSDISSVYEESQNRIYAASILGANWEDEILAGRLDKWKDFKNEYLRIQEELANASVLGATPTPTTTTGGSGGNGGTDDTDDTDDTDTSPTYTSPAEIKKKTSYKVMTGNVQAANGFSSKDEAKKWAASHGIFNCDTPSDVVYEVYLNGSLQTTTQTKEEAEKYLKQRYGITKFHSGLDEGRVSKYRSLNDDDIVKMFQSFGNGLLKPDEVPAILKTGELVMTREQQSNIAKNIQMIYQSRTKTPIIPSTNNMRNSQAVVEQHIEIHCPNVTNESGVNYIKKELTSLTTKALQYDWNA